MTFMLFFVGVVLVFGGGGGGGEINRDFIMKLPHA